MNRKLGKDLEDLLFHVRLGSLEHLCRLMKNWPEHANMPAAQAVLSLLSLERQLRRGGRLEQEDFYLVPKASLALTRAMQIAATVQPHTRKAMLALVLPKLDGMISWMSLCIRQFHVSNIELHSDDEDSPVRDESGYIRMLGCIFMAAMHYDPLLRAAMQSSATAAAFVALIWTWTDKATGAPLFIPDIGRGNTNTHGCVTNIALWDYTLCSDAALENFLQHLSHDGGEYSTANTFVEVGLSRLRTMQKACEDSMSEKPDPPHQRKSR